MKGFRLALFLMHLCLQGTMQVEGNGEEFNLPRGGGESES